MNPLLGRRPNVNMLYAMAAAGLIGGRSKPRIVASSPAPKPMTTQERIAQLANAIPDVPVPEADKLRMMQADEKRQRRAEKRIRTLKG